MTLPFESELTVESSVDGSSRYLACVAHGNPILLLREADRQRELHLEFCLRRSESSYRRLLEVLVGVSSRSPSLDYQPSQRLLRPSGARVGILVEEPRAKVSSRRRRVAGSRCQNRHSFGPDIAGAYFPRLLSSCIINSVTISILILVESRYK